MILAQIVAVTISPQCLERLQWSFQGQARNCQNSETSFSIADKGNITIAYLTCIHSTLLSTMSFFFLRARWVGIQEYPIMFLPLLDLGSRSKVMIVSVCVSFWPIAFILKLCKAELLSS